MDRMNVCLPTCVQRKFIYIRGAKRLCTGPQYITSQTSTERQTDATL